MAIKSLRQMALLLAATATVCTMVGSSSAQPPRPPVDEQLERNAAPPQADREPGYLGLVTDDRRDRGQGVRVVKVVENSPAANAGFLVDDLIVAIDGQPTGSLDEMASQVQPRPAGAKVRFEVRRGDVTRTLEAELGRRPARGERPFDFGRIPERLPEPQGGVPPVGDAPALLPNVRPPATGVVPAAPRGQLLGIRTAPVSEDFRQRIRLPDIAGARVISRVVGSPADKAAIPLDAVIVAVNNQPVASPAELAQRISAAGAGKEVELTYQFGGGLHTVRVALADGVTERAIDGPFPGDPRAHFRPLDEQLALQPGAADRIEQLERRIRELELRLQELEKALASSASAAQK